MAGVIFLKHPAVTVRRFAVDELLQTRNAIPGMQAGNQSCKQKKCGYSHLHRIVIYLLIYENQIDRRCFRMLRIAALAEDNREAGVRPEQSRYCDRGAVPHADGAKQGICAKYSHDNDRTFM